MRETSDSCYIIAGRLLNDETESYDIWLLKTDHNGDTLWTVKYDYAGDKDEASYVEETPDGGYILVGYVGTPDKDFDLFLMKTTKNGDILWTRKYGGKKFERGYCVRNTRDGCYVITGLTTSYSQELAPSDLWLMKVSANGDEIWSKRYRSTISSASSFGNSVEQTADGGYIIAGETNDHIWLLKADAFGDTTWTRSLVGRWQLGDFVGQVHQTPDEGYILVGTSSPLYFGWQVWLIKTDDQGNTMWSREYGSIDADNAESVDLTSDGGYVIGASTKSYGLDPGTYDFWIIKTDSSGRVRTEVSPVMINEPFLRGSDNLDSIIPQACFGVQSTDPYPHEYLCFCEIKDLATNKTCYLDSVLTNDKLHEPWQYDTVKFREWSASGYSDFEITFYAKGTRGDTFFSRPMSWQFHWSGISEPVTQPSSPSSEMEIISPIGSATVLRYCLNPGEAGTLKLYDASGRMVESFAVCGQGEVKVAVFSPGVYFGRLEVGGASVTRKVVVLD